MIYSDFIKLYEELSVINESCLTESNAENIDLSKCRVITSDVRDVRGELEASSCLEYNGELTRVQVRTVIIRETENGREFLAKKFRYRTSLPGGGYDQEKDHGDIIASAKREALEEFNFILTDVKDTGVRTWRHREDP
jgi:8-oxo-dGTP pyrophosphatase MutT (NUDIX family)